MRRFPSVAFPIAVVAISCSLIAQEHLPSKNPTIVTRQDSLKNVSEFLRYIDFLEHSPLDRNISERHQAAAFLLKWIDKRPEGSIDFPPFVMQLCLVNRQFIWIYLGSWARHELLHPDATTLQKHLAACGTIIYVYENGKGVASDPVVDSLVRRARDGEMERWLADELAKPYPDAVVD